MAWELRYRDTVTVNSLTRTLPTPLYVGEVIMVVIGFDATTNIAAEVTIAGATTNPPSPWSSPANTVPPNSSRRRITVRTTRLAGSRTILNPVFTLTGPASPTNTVFQISVWRHADWRPANSLQQTGTQNASGNTFEALRDPVDRAASPFGRAFAFATSSGGTANVDQFDGGFTIVGADGDGTTTKNKFWEYTSGNITDTPQRTIVNGGIVGWNMLDGAAYHDTAETIDLNSTGTATFSPTTDLSTDGSGSATFIDAPGFIGTLALDGSGETALPTAGLSVSSNVEVAGSGTLQLLFDTENSVFRVILTEGSGEATFEGNPLFEEILGLMSEGILGLSDQPPVNYLDDEGNLVPVEVIGWYDGANIQPVELLGWYDGTGIRQLG